MDYYNGETSYKPTRTHLARAGEGERLGLAALQEGAYRQAEEYLRRTALLNPGHALGHGHLAMALYHLGRFEEADRELTLAIGMSPIDDALRRARGMVLEALGRLDEASIEYRSSIALNPKSAVALGALGGLSLRESDLEAAEEYLERSVAQDPDEVQPWIHLLTIAEERGDGEGRVRALRGIVSCDQDDVARQHQLGLALEEQSAVDEAAIALGAAAVLEPENIKYQVDYARILMRQGRKDGAARLYQQVMAADPGHIAEHRDALIGLIGAQGAPTGPLLARGREGKGGAESHVNPYLEQTAGIESAIATDPGNPRLHSDLSILYMRADRMDDAMAEKLLAELLEGGSGSVTAPGMDTDMDEGTAALAARAEEQVTA